MSRRLLPAAFAATLVLGLAACADAPAPERPPTITIDMPSDGGGDTGPSDGGGEPAPSDGGGGAGTEGEPGAGAPDVAPPNPDDYPHRNLRTPEGAEQTVKYYVALVYWGRQTGESEQLETLQGDKCAACAYFLENIEELRASDKYWRSVEVDELSVELIETDVNEYEVAYVFEVSEHFEPAQGGGGDERVDRRKFMVVGGLNWTNGRWSIDAMSFEDVS